MARKNLHDQNRGRYYLQLRFAIDHTQTPGDARLSFEHLQPHLNPAHTLRYELGPSIAVNTDLGIVLFGVDESWSI